MKKDLKEIRELLIVVDMVNGFINEGVLHDENIKRIIPKIEELINHYLKLNNPVVFIKDTHDINSVEFKRFANTTHCIKGTMEAELTPELIKYEGLDNTYSIIKNSTSFMESPYFRNFISKMNNINKVDIVGCCTDICVFNGAMGLSNYFNENNQDVDICVFEDAISTYGEDTRKEYVNAAKLLMKQQGIKIV